MSSVSTAHFKYIFVGSGVAGATVVRRLLADDPACSILMLEAGPVVKAKDRRYWWDHALFDRKPYDYCYDVPGENTTVGDIRWGYEGARVMAYGGSTLHWGAWSVRYKPEDFHLRSNTGEGADWPIGYEDLEDYYYQAEQHLSVCGDLSESWNKHRAHQPYPRPDFGWTAADGAMIDGFSKAGIEPGKMPIARFRKCMTTGTCKYCPFGSRYTAQDALDELREDPRHSNFEVRCESTVTRLLADKKNRVDALEYVDAATGRTHRVSADTFIVCGGTYESAKLLLRSQTSAWPEGIGNHHDLVGRYIVSHSFLRVKGTFPKNPGHWVQEYDFPTLMSRSFDTPEMQKDGKIFLFKNRVLPNVDIGQLMIDGKTRQQIADILSGPMEQELQAFYEEKGQWRNRLTLKPGTNRFGLPLSRIDYLRNPNFAECATKRLEPMKKVLKAMDCQIQYAAWDDPGGHHATGTCRMGTSPEEGVTDKDMRVFGTDNLFVCSNATFPTCTAVNPTLTLTAMSMRLGDHLVGSKQS